jgi:hypothetical protein
MALDLIAELEALLEAFERGRIEYALCGLVAMKRLAGRPQDLADIAILEGTDEDDQA